MLLSDSHWWKRLAMNLVWNPSIQCDHPCLENKNVSDIERSGIHIGCLKNLG